ncbi:MAG: UdgX family uracil-DNA binding protein [Bryobacteraceae bacterium]|jgi:DNA polymerase
MSRTASSRSAADYIPEHAGLRTLREAAQTCRGCDLYAHATQAVFGEGPKSAEIVLIGEQPGDEEDRQGHPFVGPSGKLLDRALVAAEIDRSLVYVTNAVKHFKFEERGKRRLHKKPNGLEIRACRPWLEAEIHLLQPQIIVCLGATAAQTIFGSTYRLTKERGKFVQNAWARYVTSTVHPSAILRAPDEEQRHMEYERFVGDLKKVHHLWKTLGKQA